MHFFLVYYITIHTVLLFRLIYHGRFTRWVLMQFALVFPGFLNLRMRYAFLPPLLHHFWLRPIWVGRLDGKKEAFYLGSWSHWELWTQETPRALADWSWKGERFHSILAGGRSKSIAIATLDGQKRPRTSSILNFGMFVLDSLRKRQRSQMFKVAECCWLDGSKFGLSQPCLWKIFGPKKIRPLATGKKWPKKTGQKGEKMTGSTRRERRWTKLWTGTLFWGVLNLQFSEEMFRL